MRDGCLEHLKTCCVPVFLNNWISLNKFIIIFISQKFLLPLLEPKTKYPIEHCLKFNQLLNKNNIWIFSRVLVTFQRSWLRKNLMLDLFMTYNCYIHVLLLSTKCISHKTLVHTWNMNILIISRFHWQTFVRALNFE